MEELLALAAHCRDRLDQRIPGMITAFPGRIFCAAGCSACCTLAVETTLPEAVAIGRALAPVTRGALADYVAVLRDLAARAEDWKSFLRRKRSAGPCPLLDGEGRCTVYPLRPLACRALLATRNSAWCAVDFAELPALDRDLYRQSLDPKQVAWPTHYLAASQDLARDLEEELQAATARRLGFAPAGQLAVLAWLAAEHDLATVAGQGRDALDDLLTRTGCDRKYLVKSRFGQ